MSFVRMLVVSVFIGCSLSSTVFAGPTGNGFFGPLKSVGLEGLSRRFLHQYRNGARRAASTPAVIRRQHQQAPSRPSRSILTTISSSAAEINPDLHHPSLAPQINWFRVGRSVADTVLSVVDTVVGVARSVVGTAAEEHGVSPLVGQSAAIQSEQPHALVPVRPSALMVVSQDAQPSQAAETSFSVLYNFNRGPARISDFLHHLRFMLVPYRQNLSVFVPETGAVLVRINDLGREQIETLRSFYRRSFSETYHEMIVNADGLQRIGERNPVRFARWRTDAGPAATGLNGVDVNLLVRGQDMSAESISTLLYFAFSRTSRLLEMSGGTERDEYYLTIRTTNPRRLYAALGQVALNGVIPPLFPSEEELADLSVQAEVVVAPIQLPGPVAASWISQRTPAEIQQLHDDYDGRSGNYQGQLGRSDEDEYY